MGNESLYQSNTNIPPLGESFDFSPEDIERFKKYGMDVDNALAMGDSPEDIIEVSKEIEQEELFKLQRAEQAPPGTQSLPVEPPPQLAPDMRGIAHGEGLTDYGTGVSDIGKIFGSHLSNLVENIAGFGVQKLGEFTGNENLYDAGKYIAERANETSTNLQQSLSEGAKADSTGSRNILNFKQEGDVIPDLRNPLGNFNLGTLGQLGTGAVASMLPTIAAARKIGKTVQRIPGVKSLEDATGLGISGATGLATSAGLIEGLNSAADVHKEVMSSTDQEILNSPLYQSARELILQIYPEAQDSQMVDFMRRQIANQASFEAGNMSGGLVAATSLPMGSFLGRMGLLSGGAKNAYRQGFTKAFWTGSTREGGQEFIQEGGQQIVANYGAYLAGKSPDRISLEGFTEAGARGFAGGSTVGGVTAGVTDMFAPSKPVDIPNIDPEPEQTGEAETEADEEVSAEEEQDIFDEEGTDETVVEPTVETVVETVVEPTVETVVEPTVETPVEPTVEPKKKTKKAQQADQQVKAFEQYADDPEDSTPVETLVETPVETPVDTEPVSNEIKTEKARNWLNKYKSGQDVSKDTRIKTGEVLAFAEELGIDTTEWKDGKPTGKPIKSGAKTKVGQRILDWAKKNTSSPIQAVSDEGLVEMAKVKAVDVEGGNEGKPIPAVVKAIKAQYDVSDETRGKLQYLIEESSEKVDNWLKQYGSVEGILNSGNEQAVKDLNRFTNHKQAKVDIEGRQGEEFRNSPEAKKMWRQELKRIKKRFAALYNVPFTGGGNSPTRSFDLLDDPNTQELFSQYLEAEGRSNQQKYSTVGVPVTRLMDSDIVLRKKRKALTARTKRMHNLNVARTDKARSLDEELQAYRQTVLREADEGKTTEAHALKLIADKQRVLTKEMQTFVAEKLAEARKVEETFDKIAEKYGFDVTPLKPIFAGLIQVEKGDVKLQTESIAEASRDFTLQMKEVFGDSKIDEDGEVIEVTAKRSADANKQKNVEGMEDPLEAWMEDVAGFTGTDTLTQVEQGENEKQEIRGDTSQFLSRRIDEDPTAGAEFAGERIRRKINLNSRLRELTQKARANRITQKDADRFSEDISDEDIDNYNKSEQRKIARLLAEVKLIARRMGIDIPVKLKKAGKPLSLESGKLPTTPLKPTKYSGISPYRIVWEEETKEYVTKDTPDWLKESNGSIDEFGRTYTDMVFEVSSGSWVPLQRQHLLQDLKTKRKYKDQEGSLASDLRQAKMRTLTTAPQLSNYYPMKLAAKVEGHIKTLEIIVDDGSIDGHLIGVVEVANQDMSLIDLTGYEGETKNFKSGDLVSARFNMARNKFGIPHQAINTIVANAIGSNVLSMANNGISENFLSFRKNTREALLALDRKFTNVGDIQRTEIYDKIAFITENSDPTAPINPEEAKYMLGRGKPTVSEKFYSQKTRQREPAVNEDVGEYAFTEGMARIEYTKEQDRANDFENYDSNFLYDPFSQEAENETEAIVDMSDPYSDRILDDPDEVVKNELINEGDVEAQETELGEAAGANEYTPEQLKKLTAQYEKKLAGGLAGDPDSTVIPIDEEGTPLVTDEEQKYLDDPLLQPEEDSEMQKQVENTAKKETDLDKQCKGKNPKNKKSKGKDKDEDDDLSALRDDDNDDGLSALRDDDLSGDTINMKDPYS